MYVRNAWYAAAMAHELGDTMLARTFMDEPVVLFRTASGEAVALEDRCCHRSYPLSRGHLLADTIECGYHGFQFNSDGICVAIPNQKNIPPFARVKRYLVVEKHHFIWIWMGDPEKSHEHPIPDLSILNDSNIAWKGERMHAKANYRLITDNLSDLSHLTFVHGTTIGNTATALADITIEHTNEYVRQHRWMIDTPAPPTYVRMGNFTTNIDRWQIVTFTAPAFVELRTGGAPTGTGAPQGDTSKGIHMCNVNLITPESATTSHYFWAQTHDFHIDNPKVTDALFKDIQTAFRQDLEIFELQQTRILQMPDALNVNCRADKAQLLTRKLVDHRLSLEETTL